MEKIESIIYGIHFYDYYAYQKYNYICYQYEIKMKNNLIYKCDQITRHPN